MGKEKINMLETIFEAREEDLAFIDEKDKKFMSQDKANKIKKSDYLNKELEKILYNLNWKVNKRLCRNDWFWKLLFS